MLVLAGPWGLAGPAPQPFSQQALQGLRAAGPRCSSHAPPAQTPVFQEGNSCTRPLCLLLGCLWSVTFPRLPSCALISTCTMSLAHR